MKAVILAAGAGERLQPLTTNRPKHLLKIAGKPIIQFCLEAIKEAGIDEIIAITHYKAELIKSYFGDGSAHNLKIVYVHQPEIMGTGNAASTAETYLDGNFVLVYGDLLFSRDAVRKVLSKFESGKTAAAMGVIAVNNPENYGIVELTKENSVKRIVEKPPIGKAPSNLANAGIYVFSKEIFNQIRQTQTSIRGERELTDAITLLAKSNKIVRAVELPSEDWFDVGRPWDLLNANLWALKRMEHKIEGVVEDGAHLIGQITVAKSARIRSGAYIEGPAFIDEEADIGPNCYIRSGTTLGRKTRVGNGCELKNSILMDGTHVAHLSYVGDSVLGEKCNLGAGSIIANLRFDDGHVKMAIKGDIVDTGRRKLGAILGDNVKTGINSLIMPGVKVGSNTFIGANLLVERDLPSNSVALLKQDFVVKSRV